MAGFLGGGGIKSVQRGSAGASGTFTITAIDTTKAYVVCYSKASAGTVASNSAASWGYTYASGSCGAGRTTTSSGTMSFTLTGGTTNLFTKVYSAKIATSTTITTDGACDWEVVEFK